MIILETHTSGTRDGIFVRVEVFSKRLPFDSGHGFRVRKENTIFEIRFYPKHPKMFLFLFSTPLVPFVRDTKTRNK